MLKIKVSKIKEKQWLIIVNKLLKKKKPTQLRIGLVF